MKKILTGSLMLMSSLAFAQIKLQVNDKAVAAGNVLKAEDINKIAVAFDKYQALDLYNGKTMILIELFDESGKARQEFALVKEGYTTIKAFLADKSTYYNVPAETTSGTQFKPCCEDALHLGGVVTALKYIGKHYDAKQVKMQVSLAFREKIGYEKYGDLIYLIKPQEYIINNVLFYTEGQKEKEQEQVTKAAEKKVAAEQKAQEEKDAKSKERIDQGKRLLKRGLRSL